MEFVFKNMEVGFKNREVGLNNMEFSDFFGDGFNQWQLIVLLLRL